MGGGPVNATAEISALPAKAARMLAVEILLTDPEALGDDVLESCLYLLRERLRGHHDNMAADPAGLGRGANYDAEYNPTWLNLVRTLYAHEQAPLGSFTILRLPRLHDRHRRRTTTQRPARGPWHERPAGERGTLATLPRALP
jgi:hypothetical protein